MYYSTMRNYIFPFCPLINMKLKSGGDLAMPTWSPSSGGGWLWLAPKVIKVIPHRQSMVAGLRRWDFILISNRTESCMVSSSWPWAWQLCWLFCLFCLIDFIRLDSIGTCSNLISHNPCTCFSSCFFFHLSPDFIVNPTSTCPSFVMSFLYQRKKGRLKSLCIVLGLKKPSCQVAH